MVCNLKLDVCLRGRERILTGSLARIRVAGGSTACRLGTMSEFEAAIREGSSILTDGGIETRIMFETDIPLPPHVQVAALTTDPTGGPMLR